MRGFGCLFFGGDFDALVLLVGGVGNLLSASCFCFFPRRVGDGIKSSILLSSELFLFALLLSKLVTAVLNLSMAVVAREAAAATVATPLTKAPSLTEDVVLAAVRFRREEVAGCFPFFFGESLSIPVATRPDLV